LAGCENISIDLIFAALHQTPAMLDRDLDAVVAFSPEHVSTYELVFEDGTPFGRAAAGGRLEAFASDAAAGLAERVCERLVAAGIEQYELTNHARPGFESRHNSRYWAREPVLALGVGAHSTDPPSARHTHGARPANPRALARYFEGVAAGGPVAEEIDTPSAEQARAEALFLGLRRREGCRAGDFEAEFGASPRHFFGEAISALVTRGLLEEAGDGGLRLSRQGELLADTVFAHFV